MNWIYTQTITTVPYQSDLHLHLGCITRRHLRFVSLFLARRFGEFLFPARMNSGFYWAYSLLDMAFQKFYMGWPKDIISVADTPAIIGRVMAF